VNLAPESGAISRPWESAPYRGAKSDNHNNHGGASVRIVMIEDHTLFRDGMRLLLRKLGDDVEIIEAGGCEEILNGSQWTPPGLVLMDLGLPGLGGIEAVRSLRGLWPEVPLVVLSAQDDVETIRVAVGAGARGYILKTSNSQEMLSALRLVLAGGMYVPQYARDVMPSTAPLTLTRRQRDVLNKLALGLSNRAIAEALGMAESTVRGHVSELLAALGAHNRTEAARTALERGLTDPN